MVGTANAGLNRFDVKKNSFKSYKYNPAKPSTISSNLVRLIYETRDGTFWIATDQGLNKYDRKKETFTRFFFTGYNLYSHYSKSDKKILLQRKAPLLKFYE